MRYSKVLALLGAVVGALALQTQSEAASDRHCVTITVQTQDVSGAGTDANITATVTDDNGVAASWVLNPEMSGNAFERGSQDQANYCTDASFGLPKTLSLYSDGYGSGSAWDVNSVSVKTQYLTTASPRKEAAIVAFIFRTTLDDEQTLTRNRNSISLVSCPGCGP